MSVSRASGGTADRSADISVSGGTSAARGATSSAFERRCIPPPPHRARKTRGGGTGSGLAALLLPQVFPIVPDILGRPPSFARREHGELRRDLAGDLAETGRALTPGRLTAPCATMELQHGLPRMIAGDIVRVDHSRRPK